MAFHRAITQNMIDYINQKIDDGWTDETIQVDIGISQMSMYRLRRDGKIRPANKKKTYPGGRTASGAASGPED